MARRNGVKTVKLQVTVDGTTDRLISEMVQLGIYGPTRAEVAASILRDWLWSNQERLRQNGIDLANG